MPAAEPDASPDPDLVAAIEEACAAAGRLAHQRWTQEFRRWEKTPGNPVCDIDLEVDALLHEKLRAIDPQAGWLSEESADDPARLGCERAWMVDPIDGTRDYVRGRPGWCISVALVDRGTPLIAILDAPARRERWRAVRGQGAWRNGRRLVASTRAALPGARVPAETLPGTDADLVQIERANSIALRIAMVAADQVDLCASLRWGYEWDIAAAVLVASEAGAVVTDALARPIRFNKPVPEVLGILAAPPALHAAAVERLAARAAAAAEKR